MAWQQRHEVGDHTAGVTPVPIPNTEVKPRRADCTARETVWESRSSPALIKAQLRNQLSLFRFGNPAATAEPKCSRGFTRTKIADFRESQMAFAELQKIRVIRFFAVLRRSTAVRLRFFLKEESS
jgi:hypothetical protein